MYIEVECYAGYRGEETPRYIRMAANKIKVKEVVDRWLAPDHRYFKIIGEDDATVDQCPVPDQGFYAVAVRGVTATDHERLVAGDGGGEFDVDRFHLVEERTPVGLGVGPDEQYSGLRFPFGDQAGR